MMGDGGSIHKADGSAALFETVETAEQRQVT